MTSNLLLATSGVSPSTAPNRHSVNASGKIKLDIGIRYDIIQVA